MNPLDDELKRALERREPPDGFTRRVLERAGAGAKRGGARRGLGWLWLPQFRWAAAAVAGLLIAASAVEYQRYRRAQAEGERAREQVMLALQIASSKLNGALGEVRQVEARQPAGRTRATRARRTGPAR